ncbi:hypothetical protein [Anaerotignum sp.]|uniref:hypothetical protein n=1 Tax=Anaerotignum sp. TaxID=2039241 RepID=UPI0028A6BD68|nr:hypothetical protein [Anaerotignum sp.]
MKWFEKCPRVLLQKLWITLFLGAGCLTVGAVYYFSTGDTIFLFLSIILSSGCIWRCYSLYHVISSKQYHTTEGICVGIAPKHMRRYRSVYLVDAEGLETSLLLDKRIRVKIGYRYRLYFKKDKLPSLGIEYLDTALSTGHFLGIEDLGEFPIQSDKKVVLTKSNK